MEMNLSLIHGCFGGSKNCQAVINYVQILNYNILEWESIHPSFSTFWLMNQLKGERIKAMYDIQATIYARAAASTTKRKGMYGIEIKLD